jgi:hypothetical protein
MCLNCKKKWKGFAHDMLASGNWGHGTRYQVLREHVCIYSCILAFINACKETLDRSKAFVGVYTRARVCAHACVSYMHMTCMYACAKGCISMICDHRNLYACVSSSERMQLFCAAHICPRIVWRTSWYRVHDTLAQVCAQSLTTKNRHRYERGIHALEPCTFPKARNAFTAVNLTSMRRIPLDVVSARTLTSSGAPYAPGNDM